VVNKFIDAVVAGVGLGSVYALIAFGYSLIFSTMGILNLAQGQILGLGIMLSFGLRVTLGWNPLAVLAVVLLAGALVGAGEELVAVRFLRGRARVDGWLVTTLGAALIIEGGLLLYWGGTPKPYPALFSYTGLRIGDVVVSPQTLVALGTGLALTLGLWTVNRFTRAGWALQAIAEDREAAALRGINVRRATWATFAAAAAISSVAGWIIVPITKATTTLGFVLGLKGFVAMLIGGQGSAAAALVGGLCLGIAEQLGTHFGPSGIGDVYGFVLMAMVITVRPAGIFAGAAVRRA
jgi:branched-chain amino acid transport system permease protein